MSDDRLVVARLAADLKSCTESFDAAKDEVFKLRAALADAKRFHTDEYKNRVALEKEVETLKKRDKPADQWYATDGEEWTSSYAGPFESAEAAILEFLEQYDPEDGSVHVTRGRDVAVPKIGTWAVERIEEQVFNGECDGIDNWLDSTDRAALREAIDDAVAKWINDNNKQPIGWVGYGKSEDLSINDARERVGLPVKKEES